MEETVSIRTKVCKELVGREITRLVRSYAPYNDREEEYKVVGFNDECQFILKSINTISNSGYEFPMQAAVLIEEMLSGETWISS